MIDAMRAAGLAPVKELDLRPDGKLVRYRVEGDKPGSRNGWAVLHGGPVAASAFGSWRTGESHVWSDRDSQTLTPEERAEAWRGFVREVLPALADGRIAPVIDKVFAFGDLPAAKAYVDSDAQLGKVVVRIG